MRRRGTTSRSIARLVPERAMLTVLLGIHPAEGDRLATRTIP